ncbi:MAG: hypothetical protein ACLUV5_13580 [Oscillospiraceae bacterium]|mgnify:FL=1
MRDLKRNQISVEYALYLGNAELTDDNGCATGEFAPKYGDKTALMISVSSNKGDYSQQQFGNLLDYDRTMITHDTRCPINENSLVYIGTEQYIVKAVAKSLNAVQYATKRVQIDETYNG